MVYGTFNRLLAYRSSLSSYQCYNHKRHLGKLPLLFFVLVIVTTFDGKIKKGVVKVITTAVKRLSLYYTYTLEKLFQKQILIKTVQI